MNCFYHKNMEATNNCAICAHPLCGDCVVEVKGRAYCQDCLDKQLTEKGAAPPERLKSPGLAGFLSAIIPGLGQIYNSQYMKAFVVILLYMAFLSLAIRGPVRGIFVFPLLIMVVYFGAIIDAYRSAKEINLAGRGVEAVEREAAPQRESAVWGVIIILIGVLFLLYNFDVSIDWLEDLWPLIVIFLGGYYMVRYFLNQKKGKAERKEPPSEGGEK